MKIVICGLVKSENLGEQFISKSLAWIIKDEIKKMDVLYCLKVYGTIYGCYMNEKYVKEISSL